MTSAVARVANLISRSLSGLVVVALVVVPSLALAPPAFWRLDALQLSILGAFSVAWLLAQWIVTLPSSAREATPPLRILVGSAFLTIPVAVLVFTEWQWPTLTANPFPRLAVLAALLIGVLGIAGRVGSRRWQLAIAVLLSALIAAALALHGAFHKRWLPRPPAPAENVTYAESAFYSLELRTYSNWFPKRVQRGGALALWGDAFVVTNGNGDIVLARRRTNGNGLDVRPFARPIPLNAGEFVSGAGKILSNTPRNRIDSSRFRVTDIVVQPMGDRARIFASHHYWHSARQCFVIRVSMIEGTQQSLLQPTGDSEWRTLFDSSPCLKLNTDNPNGPLFEGLDSGGRMLIVSNDEMLLTIGDHAFDGVHRTEALAQDPAASYGKVLKMSLDGSRVEVFSMGHRNAQGLLKASNGTLWLTEHGPRGGDELNRLEPGANYGWPLVTYGTDYGRRSWPASESQGEHARYTKPAFAFVPSVGLSQLVEADAELFPLWRGDLLLASLKAATLFRVRFDEQHVMYVEPIVIGQAIRDVEVDERGRLVMLTADNQDLIVAEPSTSHVGDTLVAQCTGCHGLNHWDPSTVAPTLFGIVGRRVAERDDFTYSEAMRDFGGRWSRERLDAFIEDPQAVVPGTTMLFPGVKSPEDRRLIIDYLETMVLMDPE